MLHWKPLLKEFTKCWLGLWPPNQSVFHSIQASVSSFMWTSKDWFARAEGESNCSDWVGTVNHRIIGRSGILCKSHLTKGKIKVQHRQFKIQDVALLFLLHHQPLPYLFLSVEPSVHHWVVGTEGRASHLSLELSGPATCITRKTPVGVGSSTLQRNRRMWKD